MKTIRVVIRSFCLAGLLMGSSMAWAASFPFITGSQRVDYTKTTPAYAGNGGFKWDVHYERGFDDSGAWKHVEIGFDFDVGLGWDDERKEKYRKDAERNIENMWNNRASIIGPDGQAYPCSVDVTTGGPFDANVKVKATQGSDPEPYNVTHWYVDQDTPSYQAHEFGHMLGLPDEYWGGALATPNNTNSLSPKGLMGLGATNAAPEMYSRYYQQFVDYVRDLNTAWADSFVLRVPESAPGFTLEILTMILLFLLARKFPMQACPPMTKSNSGIKDLGAISRGHNSIGVGETLTPNPR